jgi:hypothetical protein
MISRRYMMVNGDLLKHALECIHQARMITDEEARAPVRRAVLYRSAAHALLAFSDLEVLDDLSAAPSAEPPSMPWIDEEKKPEAIGRVLEHDMDPPHARCLKPSRCSCECLACKRAWFAAGRPRIGDAP